MTSQVNDMKNRPNWTHARIRAYARRKTHLGCYLYMFNENPEHWRNQGVWTEEEHNQFMARFLEVGDGQWGPFSRPIPTRNGQQCRKYFSTLRLRGIKLEYKDINKKKKKSVKKAKYPLGPKKFMKPFWDPVTGKSIRYPLMSKNFHVLEAETWHCLGYKCPWTGEQFSLDDLIVIDGSNLLEYADRIKKVQVPYQKKFRLFLKHWSGSV